MKRFVFGAAVASLLAGCSGAMTLENAVGAVARTAQAALPIGVEKEREIGFGIATTIAGRYPILDDPELTRYVNLVGLTVAQQSPRYGEIPFRFAVLDTDVVNAFATPGGYVFITKGALDLMTSEAELAAVLAHEVAHVDEKHTLDDIRRSDALSSVADETQIGGPLLDRIAEQTVSEMFTKGMSREDEAQADSLGLLYATAVGYDPDGLAHFLEHLTAAEGAAAEDPALREWISTHPSTAERLTAVQRQILGYGWAERPGVMATERFEQVAGARSP